MIVETSDVASIVFPAHLQEALAIALRKKPKAADELNREIQALRIQHRTRYAEREIDYDQLVHAFTYKYFAANYIANRALLDRCACPALSEARTFFDIGSGSGASLLAHLDYLHGAIADHHRVTAVGFDRSGGQLEMARSIIGGLDPLVAPYASNINLFTEDMVQPLGVGSKPFLNPDGRPWVIMSFFLGELRKREADAIVTMVLELVKSGDCLGATIVETTDRLLDSLLENIDVSDFRVCRQRLDGVRVQQVISHAAAGAEEPKSIVRAHGLTISRR